MSWSKRTTTTKCSFPYSEYCQTVTVYRLVTFAGAVNIHLENDDKIFH